MRVLVWGSYVKIRRANGRACQIPRIGSLYDPSTLDPAILGSLWVVMGHCHHGRHESLWVVMSRCESLYMYSSHVKVFVTRDVYRS